MPLNNRNNTTIEITLERMYGPKEINTDIPKPIIKNAITIYQGYSFFIRKRNLPIN